MCDAYTTSSIIGSDSEFAYCLKCWRKVDSKFQSSLALAWTASSRANASGYLVFVILDCLVEIVAVA